jgi:LysM repeat protein
VKPGDTLRGIAAQFEVSVDALFRYNGLSTEEADSLRPGQRLFVPPQRGAEPQAPAAPRPTATRRPAPSPRSYFVEPGDTLRGIAAQFEVSAAELQRYNGLSAEEADSLRPGQRLFIPPR